MRSTPRSFLLLLVAAICLSEIPTLAAQGAPAQTKVESEVLVVGEPGLQYFLSPKGQHMAAVVLRGSRKVVVHDGVDGPRFDEIMTSTEVSGSTGLVRFSEDGNRYAYLGRVGQEYVVMVDGKEAARIPGANPNQTPVKALGFTPGGKHWYVILLSNISGRGKWQLVIDGQAGPVSNEDLVPVWSPDGEHHAYLQTIFPPTATQPRRVLIVDGKPAGYSAGEPQFTGDGLHLFTRRTLPGSEVVEILADGQPFMRVPGGAIQLYMAPRGPGVLGVVWTPFQGASSRHAFLTIGNRKVPGSECAGSAGLDRVFISPDAKRWAVRCQTGNSSYWIMADGKKGSEYGLILADVAFTADGRSVYAAQMQNKWFVVVGDQESDGYDNLVPPTLTPAQQRETQGKTPPPVTVSGNRVGFIARSNSGQVHWVVIDGKAIQRQAREVRDLGFSPDGSRYAWAEGVINRLAVVVDGVAHTGMGLAPLEHFWPKFSFSPDGKHIAYFAAPETDAQGRGIAIDGKFVASSAPGSMQNLTFTPDGKHLLWLNKGFYEQNFTVFVDGQPVLEEIGPLNPQHADIWWSMGQDGVLTFIGQQGNEMKRFRITPGSSTSVETLLAKSRE